MDSATMQSSDGIALSACFFACARPQMFRRVRRVRGRRDQTVGPLGFGARRRVRRASGSIGPSCRRSCEGIGPPTDSAAEEARVSKPEASRRRGAQWDRDRRRSINGRRQQVRSRASQEKDAQRPRSEALAISSTVRTAVRRVRSVNIDEWSQAAGRTRTQTVDDRRISLEIGSNKARAGEPRVATDHGRSTSALSRELATTGSAGGRGPSRRTRLARSTR